MSFADSFKKSIFDINEENFEDHALRLFEYQYTTCDIYHQYSNHLKRNPSNVKSINQIPFLPIECFKNHAVKSGKWTEEKIFMSSGTTMTGRSKHYIQDLNFYLQVTEEIFAREYQKLSDYQVLALLPSYQEQGDSSLIAMVDYFMQRSQKRSRYFLEDYELLVEKLMQNKSKKLLIGVSYALLDLAEKHPMKLKDTIIMETGGMKGRRKEITRNELHQQLKKAFQQDCIHSEYGMTELLSQAYGKDGLFRFPSWANILIREINDPFNYVKDGVTGGISVIDLANVDSCAFIETKDLGRRHKEYFEVLGRFDNSDVRGCNLMF